MADVADKCISANPIRGGGAVIKIAAKECQIKQQSSGLYTQIAPSGLETKYTDRFDDRGYYDSIPTP